MSLDNTVNPVRRDTESHRECVNCQPGLSQKLLQHLAGMDWRQFALFSSGRLNASSSSVIILDLQASLRQRIAHIGVESG